VSEPISEKTLANWEYVAAGREPVVTALCAEVRRLQQRLTELRDLADQYERDGQPGPLGYNCWGWREIADALRKAGRMSEGN
jgi:hypothetical protein